MITNIKYGWKRSTGDLGIPHFKVGNKLKALAANNTSNEYLIPEVPVFDQGGIGSCVGNGTIGLLMILMLNEGLNVKMLSRLFAYWNARAKINETNQDNGCFIHDCLATLKDLGVCLEDEWVYDETKVFTQPNDLAFKEGDDNNNLAAYYEVVSSDQQRLIDIDTAIRANHPVIFGSQVGSDLQNYDGNPNTVFDFPTNPIGGHCMVITGTRLNSNNEKEFYIRNSWGSSFGLNGHMWFSSSYITNENTDDLFVATRMNDLLL